MGRCGECGGRATDDWCQKCRQPTTQQGLVQLVPVPKSRMGLVQRNLTERHYLHRPIDPRATPEGYFIDVDVAADTAPMWHDGEGRDWRGAGYLLFGRPEAQRCGTWYGSVDDVAAGRCEVTRWQILNLARVWAEPAFQIQAGPFGHGRFALPGVMPGFTDRRGRFRPTLVSEALTLAARQVGYDYLLRRPPVFLSQPYEIRWLLSYCDTSRHTGHIYRAAGFELYREGGGKSGTIQTWRLPLPALSEVQRNAVAAASRANPRAQAYRAAGAQGALFGKEVLS